MLHRRAGTLRWGGMDLAAHCIDDVLCSGAKPLFLLDYVAAEHVDLEQVAELVEGAAEVCRAAGCALVGGETAELPGVYRDGRARLRRHVRRHRRPRRRDRRLALRTRRLVVGFPSSGLHTNGFSLVRTLGERLRRRAPARPHRLYLDDVRALRVRADVKALAHVTGGGILGNLSRVLPDGVRARIDWHSWERPPVFALARGSWRRGGRGAPRLQPRDRHVRGRPRGAAGRARDRGARVIGVLVSGEGTNLQALARRRPPDRRDRIQPARRLRAPARAGRSDRRVRARRVREPRGARRGNGAVARGAGRAARRARRLHAPAHAARSSTGSRARS